ncbi:BglG family transcription antiterminator [Clostridium akagii]|uniref:BglG family transcription antiterminator n=1 Tax=Clostridium akagii TaxID=91623 RepID=UPI00068D74C5|nr:BglG family transcription antiterminator [Clostridium akagii]
MINERCAKILYHIINEQEPIKLIELSEMFKVSMRTIRYDIEKIDEFLLSNDLTPIGKNSNLGISYMVNKEHIKKLKVLICNKKFNEYILNSDERVSYILLSMFESNEYVVIDTLAESIKVSRSTIINDLKKVRKWLKDHKLKMQAIPSKGIKIIGNEKYYRSAILYLLFESLKFIGTDSISKTETINPKMLNEKFNNIFDDLDIEVIKETVGIAEKQLNKYLLDESYSSLVLHIALAIKRIQFGKDIHMSSNELKILKVSNEFSVASVMVKTLEEKFNINFPIDEVGYITLHLLSGKENSKKSEIHKDVNWVQIEALSSKIIENVGKQMGVDFGDNDEIYEGLLKHLIPTIYRLKNNLPLYNPMLNEIKEQYSLMFDKVRSSIEPLEKFIGQKIPDEELGYITLHFGAAYERKKNKHKAVYNVILICSTGVGTSKLLESRLNSEFHNFRIIENVSSHQVKFMNLEKIDLILSTIPLEYFYKPILIVSPMLPDKDIEKINKFCRENSPIKGGESYKHIGLLNEIISIVEDNCSIICKEKLINELSKCIKNAGQLDTKEVIQPMLSELLTKDTIRANVYAADWKEAVRQGGALLVDNGCIEPRFIDAMIETVIEMGPYIVIVPGIALPHARPSEGVIKLGMSLIKLSVPVNFGSEDNDPVSVVICLGAIDNYSHSKALSTLVDLFNDEEKVEMLKNANSVEEILPLLKDKDENDFD